MTAIPRNRRRRRQPRRHRRRICLAAARHKRAACHRRRRRHVGRRGGAARRAGGVRRRPCRCVAALHGDHGRLRAGQRRHRPRHRQDRLLASGAGRRGCTRLRLPAGLADHVDRPVHGSARRADRRRLVGHLRSADRRHFALVRAPARRRGVDGGCRKLPGRRLLAARHALCDAARGLALHLCGHRHRLPGRHGAAGADAAQGGTRRRLAGGDRPAGGAAHLRLAGAAAGAAGRRRPRLLRRHVDAAGAHRRLLHGSRLRHGARLRNAVDHAGRRRHQPARLRFPCRPHRRHQDAC